MAEGDEAIGLTQDVGGGEGGVELAGPLVLGEDFFVVFGILPVRLAIEQELGVGAQEMVLLLLGEGGVGVSFGVVGLIEVGDRVLVAAGGGGGFGAIEVVGEGDAGGIGPGDQEDANREQQEAGGEEGDLPELRVRGSRVVGAIRGQVFPF